MKSCKICSYYNWLAKVCNAFSISVSSTLNATNCTKYNLTVAEKPKKPRVKCIGCDHLDSNKHYCWAYRKEINNHEYARECKKEISIRYITKRIRTFGLFFIALMIY